MRVGNFSYLNRTKLSLHTLCHTSVLWCAGWQLLLMAGWATQKFLGALRQILSNVYPPWPETLLTPLDKVVGKMRLVHPPATVTCYVCICCYLFGKIKFLLLEHLCLVGLTSLNLTLAVTTTTDVTLTLTLSLTLTRIALGSRYAPDACVRCMRLVRLFVTFLIINLINSNQSKPFLWHSR